MADDDKRIEKLEARIRALEAILLEMPEVTEQRVEAARERVRNKVLNAQGGKFRELYEKLGKTKSDQFLDEAVEVPLKELAYELKQRDKD